MDLTGFMEVLSTPVGEVTLVATQTELVSLQWGRILPKHPQSGQSEVMKLARSELHEYFAGKRHRFTVPLAAKGTDFQKRAWQELLKIPYGKTLTYGEQAQRLGHPKAARAVGAANGKNPIGILIPCHRVVGSTGNLTGFAGGLGVKRRLLELETFYSKDQGYQ